MAGDNCIHNRATCLFLAAFFLFTQGISPAIAGRLPMGAIASSKRLGGISGDRDKSSSTYNLSYVPMLLELAKVLGRFQSAPGYYLQNEPFANQPGIDLRSVLLNQSGPLQLLRELQQAGNTLPDTDPDTHNLSVRRLESSTDGSPDSMAPQLQVPVLPALNHPAPISHPPAQVASPDKINLQFSNKGLTSAPAPLITLDFPSLSHTFTGIKAAIPSAPVEAPQLQTSVAAAIPLSPTAHSSNYAFLFWTLRSFNSSGGSGSAFNAHDYKQGDSDMDYTTLVACMPGTRFNSVARDQLHLSQGRLLAASGNQKLSFHTPLGEVQMSGRSALTLDLNNDSLQVSALESANPGDVMVVYTDTAGSPQKYQLLAGQRLLITGRTPPNSPARFSVTGVLQNDPLLNVHNPELTEAQRSALYYLQQRLKENLQAGK